eukprot:CAMPEP_0171219382 /NCGR_PEP_ID=MMETSP0790-20130122/33687_1 /TAXON_ID=2925 /ORGANISM="Alexandrium catenella, Strain OF101" /LENGTH=104 /DNA_ID=CAMNT_0011685231 /DNA_START=52 /DNA_END=363 /DNA_ORIENTATION=-
MRCQLLVALATFLRASVAEDDVVLLQSSVDLHEGSAEGQLLSRLAGRESGRSIVEQATHMHKKMGATAPMDRIKDAVTAGRQLVPGFKEKVSAAWKSFHERAKG